MLFDGVLARLCVDVLMHRLGGGRVNERIVNERKSQ